jgi:hypothetical protein
MDMITPDEVANAVWQYHVTGDRPHLLEADYGFVRPYLSSRPWHLIEAFVSKVKV